MILRTLYQYAQQAELLETMETTERLVHLVLLIEPDGSIHASGPPWLELNEEVVVPAKGNGKQATTKVTLGRRLFLPEFPGVNSGGKAHFLADAVEKVLGLDTKTGQPLPDDNQNASKAFKHFWERILKAHDTLGSPDLAALLAFRERYLLTDAGRGELGRFVGMIPQGKEARPTCSALTPGREGGTPLEKKTMLFKVGALGNLFEEDSQLHDYWKKVFRDERFVTGAKLGTCLVTGETQQPIAEVHRTLIKGVPGLPPIGGYLVSFDASTPSLTSYGFEGGWNASISEGAAVGYALALNKLLADKDRRRVFGKAVLCTWVNMEEGENLSDQGDELGEEVNDVLEGPGKEAIRAFFHSFESQGRFHHALNSAWFHSVTLAANGGRIVVRRWLDIPLKEAVTSLKRWFDDLDIEPNVVPPPQAKAGKKSKRQADPSPESSVELEPAKPQVSPLSMYALAGTTARVPSEVQSTVYDTLYRAALEQMNPLSLLGPILQRLRIMAAESGSAMIFSTSHFCLIKLILNRTLAASTLSEKGNTMTIQRELAETNDPAYNCGRLLALLDNIQCAAQGEVGANIISRYFGKASTFPRNALNPLLRLKNHHVDKLRKNPMKRGFCITQDKLLCDVCSQFPRSATDGSPDFPGFLSLQEQGRFVLGFYQQKAQTYREFLEWAKGRNLKDLGREVPLPFDSEAVELYEALTCDSSR